MIFFLLISYPGIRASVHESFLPGMNSSRYLVLYLLLFTRFRPGKTSSWDDYFPVLRTGMKCHLGIKCQANGLPGMKVAYVNSVCETWAR